jgi:hypothetical protein
VSVPFPEPTSPVAPGAEVFLGYLDYFRDAVLGKLDGLGEHDLRASRLPSGWPPIALAKHLTFVERRWLEWGFEGRDVGDPWGDHRDERWHVDPSETTADVLAALRAQGKATRRVVGAHALTDVGVPGPRWDGAPPATLERVLFHLVQEYARHAGQLDVVRELIDGRTGE